MRPSQAVKDQLHYPDMRNFSYKHLPPDLAQASEPFCRLAEGLNDFAPVNLETAVALRKLLEAKDAAVRAHVLCRLNLAQMDREAQGDLLATCTLLVDDGDD